MVPETVETVAESPKSTVNESAPKSKADKATAVKTPE